MTGVAFCVQCGSRITVPGRFCAYCGAALPDAGALGPGARLDDEDPADGAGDIRLGIGRRRWTARGAYCDLHDGMLLSGFAHPGRGRAEDWLARSIADHGLSVSDQGGGIVGGGWALAGGSRAAPVWFSAGTLDGMPTVLAGSTIAGIRPGYPQIAIPGSPARRSFADLVVCPAEQNEAAAMISRLMGGMSGRVAPVGDPQPEECNLALAPVDDLPRRVLLLEPAERVGSLVLLTYPGQGPVYAPMPAGSASMVLVYAVPAYESHADFDDTLATVVDSLLRVHELLWDTASGLDGRHDPAQAPLLDRLLATTGVVGVLDLADQPWRLQ